MMRTTRSHIVPVQAAPTAWQRCEIVLACADSGRPSDAAPGLLRRDVSRYTLSLNPGGSMATMHEGIQAGTQHVTPRSSRPGPAGSMRPATPTAKDIMTDRVTCLRVDQSIAEAIQLLVSKGISGAPVQDHNGALVGVLSELDCMQLVTSNAYHQGESARMRRVDEFMSRTLYRVSP